MGASRQPRALSAYHAELWPFWRRPLLELALALTPLECFELLRTQVSSEGFGTDIFIKHMVTPKGRARVAATSGQSKT
jgi:hypothetical protein